MIPRLAILGSLLFAAVAVRGTVAAPPAGPEGVEFFEKKIRPLLVDKCYNCHSVEKGKTKGGLNVDTRDALRQGGDSGPALVPGDPEKSKLIEGIRWQNQDFQMPPKQALSAQEIADLEAWVKMGAPDPRDAAAAKTAKGIDIEEGRKFWSFQPLGHAAPPAVKYAAWVKTPVDAFILAELEKSGLTPAPPADKRTLIRRATFDLTGLPPTPSEVQAFLDDSSPGAFDHVVERLLASPQYGERWGRHWLDVARYADSNGMDENVAYGHSWRYRDYVVRAFNRDKPYDQFLIEQIAGDLLPASEGAPREECLTATGFLALGARVLAEPDLRKLQMDIIDEQMDTLGKAFLGMTFGCCRCHDHKFDPIPTADYYSLAAIFRSTRSLADEKMGAIKFAYEHSLATPEQLQAKKDYDAKVKAEAAKLAKFSAELRAKLKLELQGAAADYLAAAAELPAEPEFAQVKALAEQKHLRPRYLLTCRQYLTQHPAHPFFTQWREMSAAGPEAVHAYYGKLFQDTADALKEAKAKDAKATQPADPNLAAAQAALDDVAGFLAIPDNDENAFDGEMLASVDAMKSSVMALEEKGPEPPALMGVADIDVVKTLPIHLRGSYLTLGREVERGFPQVMRTTLSPAIFPAHQSGRLELARWMASGEHPLTARVMVNRIWRWHFGRGIVSTTDNFGRLGDRPSHPEMLDWLARHFVEEGWSVKEMHRLLMHSSVYQMASLPTSSAAATIDPENRLLSHANLQRLDAEEVRDAMLAASGSLDLTVGGKTIPLHDREFVFNHTSHDNTSYETERRALYIPIIRNHLYGMLEQYDYPDPTMPTGSRNATVVASQALIMLNSPFVMEAGDKLSALLHLDPHANDADRVRRAYIAVYARPATEHEIARAIAFLDRQPDPEQAWPLLCHTLLAANEFIYLR